ncbi:alpha-galactosidase [Amnibacterium sp. CER49]|uniref:alpha-galactosidase n=1 Tax=Amnibacterium sp. CER49 TaxID=3039161 RepID=UPI00244D21B1|nr:alpha-galactosidase [Amnibacterium sp. CER49]MDH2444101.1 alpha-galactosidase [Amnibacterium sp. CER49]
MPKGHLDDTLSAAGVPAIAGLSTPDGPGERTQHAERLGDTGEVWEFGLSVRNTSTDPLDVRGLEPLNGRLAGEGWNASWFRSAWGEEFEPEGRPVAEGVSLVGTAGRSSHGVHPWLLLERVGQAVLICPAWSGNWSIRIERDGALRAGVSPDQLQLTLAPGDSVSAPVVYVSVGANADEAVSQLADAVGKHVIPRSAASERLAVEWNSWWPYEDQEIEERVFTANARLAKQVGAEYATLDAGWFGASDPESDWTFERGDWDAVNDARFPSGLRDLAERTRAEGLAFGIWLEAEAVGARARLRTQQPEILARRIGGEPVRVVHGVGLDPDDPGFLGYVCMGSPAGRAYVAAALDDVIARTGAEWLKLDFNIDPGPGCNRTDHGHGAGDGLFRHYQALYEVLDEFRKRHPDVIFEACSSGGLRIDLGLAKHVHCMFLSDPDWTEHHLQTLWGVSRMLPPAAILHFTWSQWRHDHPDQKLDFGSISVDDFDTTIRAAMLHRWGVSLRLPELRRELLERLGQHIEIYRSTLAPLVREGRLRPVNGQPRRHGAGERRPVFQLSGDSAHVLGVFVLPGGEFSAVARWAPDSALVAERRYRVSELGGRSEARVVTGRDLLEGVSLLQETGATSWLLLAEALAD